MNQSYSASFPSLDKYFNQPITNIIGKRTYIRNRMLKICFNDNPNVTSLTVKDLKTLFHRYDEVWFKEGLQQLAKYHKIRIRFGILKATKTAGECKYEVNLKCNCVISNCVGPECMSGVCTISVSKPIITGIFNQGEKQLKVNGIHVKDRLEALQVVFEHELVHMYMYLKGLCKKGKGYYSSHGTLFSETSLRFFGHTEFRHSLLHGDSSDMLVKANCFEGMKVYFNQKSRRGINRVQGEIVKLNPKRAKVLSIGRLYAVPYEMLKSVNSMY